MFWIEILILIIYYKFFKLVLQSEIREWTLIVEKVAIFSVLSSNDSMLIFLEAFKAGVDSVDGKLGHWVLHGVALSLADGLHTAGLVLNIHVVEGHVHDVNAIVHL